VLGAVLTVLVVLFPHGLLGTMGPARREPVT
jgi:hypothetical protein